MGLYLLLWGKGKDEQLSIATQEPSSQSRVQQNEPELQIVSMGTEMH